MSAWGRYLADPWLFRAERLRLPSGLSMLEALARDPWQRRLWEIVDSPDIRVATLVGQRGVGKTEWLASVAVERLSLRRGHRVIAVANDSDQASLLRDAAAGFIERDPMLSHLLDVQRWKIINASAGSELRILSSDAISSYGLGAHPTTFVVDECWGVRNRDLLDAILSAVAKNSESQVLLPTNAGFVDTPAHDLMGLCGEDDPAFVLWDSHAEGVWPSWMDPAEKERQRKLLPESVYLRLWENKWTSGAGDFLTEEDVESCVDESLDAGALNFRRDAYSYLGVDLGLKHDRSVVVVGHKEQERFTVDHVTTWQGTSEQPVSLEDVAAYLSMLRRKIPNLRRGYLDPWQGVHLLERLRRGGMRALEEYSFTSQNVMKLSQATWNAFRSGQIAIPAYGPLVSELVRARVVEKRYGWRVDHEAGGYSDHLIALGLALVASAEESGSLVTSDTELDAQIRHLRTLVRSEKRFGLGRPKRVGLRLANIAGQDQEDYGAAIRLLQLLAKSARISRQEADQIADGLRSELARQPSEWRLLESSTDTFDPGGALGHHGLGRIADFLNERTRPPLEEETCIEQQTSD